MWSGSRLSLRESAAYDFHVRADGDLPECYIEIEVHQQMAIRYCTTKDLADRIPVQVNVKDQFKSSQALSGACGKAYSSEDENSTPECQRCRNLRMYLNASSDV